MWLLSQISYQQPQRSDFSSRKLLVMAKKVLVNSIFPKMSNFSFKRNFVFCDYISTFVSLSRADLFSVKMTFILLSLFQLKPLQWLETGRCESGSEIVSEFLFRLKKRDTKISSVSFRAGGRCWSVCWGSRTHSDLLLTDNNNVTRFYRILLLLTT